MLFDISETRCSTPKGRVHVVKWLGDHAADDCYHLATKLGGRDEARRSCLIRRRKARMGMVNWLLRLA